MLQDTAWLLSLVLMGIVVSIFAVVCAGAGRRGEVANPYRGRALVVWVLLLGGLVIFVLTLSPWPMRAYAAGADKPVMSIDVVGHQWRWELSATDVPVGKPVEFRLTAADVNHGFGIYKDKQRMLGQVQAMPGYTNRLVVTFDEPGTYQLLCMEYCGVSHHLMVATITAR